MELFRERGYGRTTVEGIAARAGLTERTFFRYFTDKREVLFSGSNDLEKILVDTIASAPKEAAPFDVVAEAFEAAGTKLQTLRDFSHVRARHALVVGHAELRERELIKFASLAAAVTEALHARGVSEPAASLAAEAGLAIFKVGVERWVGGKKPPDLAAHIRAAKDVLKIVAASITAPSTVRAAGASKRGSSTGARSKQG
jgi:AcrR family transcriptional regulator